MHPILFNIGPIPIHSYGVMLAIAFLSALYISSKRAEKVNISKDLIMDLAFWIILSAILGARLYYVILHPEEFKGHWLDTINPFGKEQFGIGGLVMLGGMYGVIITSFIFLKIKKAPFLKIADIISPTIGLGIFVTRIGCFLNGCCYGKCTTLPIGVSFKFDSPAGHFMQQMSCHSLHPSQLYLSSGGLIIFSLLLLLDRFKKFEGQTFFSLIALYSILRFVVDYTRFYLPDERIITLSHNQFLCILMFATAIISGIIIYKKSIKKIQQ